MIAGHSSKVEHHFATLHPDAPNVPPPANGAPVARVAQLSPPRDAVPSDEDANAAPPSPENAAPPPLPANGGRRRGLIMQPYRTPSPPPLDNDDTVGERPANSDVCEICRCSDLRHMCICGRACARIGTLLEHIGYSPLSQCKQDPHRRLLALPGSCGVCAEEVEKDPAVYAQHLQAHENLCYWCTLCKKKLADRRYGDEHHYRVHGVTRLTKPIDLKAPLSSEIERKDDVADVRVKQSNGTAPLAAKVVNSTSLSRLRGDIASPPPSLPLGDASQRVSRPPVPVAVALVDLDLPAEPDADGSGDDGSGADVCSFVSEDGNVAAPIERPVAAKRCNGAHRVPSRGACRVCNRIGGAHVCRCGQECARVSVLHAHVAAARGRGECQLDPHRQQLGRDGTCGVCGEPLEANREALEQHKAMHKIGLFWCVDCRKPVTMRMKAIEAHFAAEAADEAASDDTQPGSPLPFAPESAADAVEEVEEVDDGGARERLLEVDDQLQGLTDLAEQLAVYTSTLYAKGEEVRRALEPVAGGLRRNRAYADELLGGVRNFRSADQSRAFIAYAMVPADALVDVRLSHDRRALVLSYSTPPIAAGDITSAMPRGLPVHIQQTLVNHVGDVVATSLSRRPVTLRLRLAHAVNLASFHAWKVFRPNAVKVLFFSGAYDFTEPVVRVGGDAM
jgi:hypothetical protein